MSRLERRSRDEGAGTVWVLAVAALLVASGAVVVTGAAVRVERARVATAADLAALAAADRWPAPGACDAAQAVTLAAGMALTRCSTTASTVEVEVLGLVRTPWLPSAVVRVRAKAGPPGGG